MKRFLCGATLLALVLGAFPGCQKASPQFESRSTFPVEGKLLIRGKPVQGVQVFFHPRDATQRGKPRGVTDAEGKFQLRTYRDGDGAPPGDYTVTVYWPGRYNPKVAVDDQLPPDRLGERFLDPRNSSLRATVSAAPTTLPPFDIR